MKQTALNKHIVFKGSPHLGWVSNLKIDKGSVQKPRIHHFKGTILQNKSCDQTNRRKKDVTVVCRRDPDEP